MPLTSAGKLGAAAEAFVSAAVLLRRARGQRPGELKRPATGIGRLAAVEVHRHAARDGLVGAGVRDRRRAHVRSRRDEDGVWRAVHDAVVHDELGNVVAGPIGRERRLWRGRVAQRGGTPHRRARQRPPERQCIAIRVARPVAIERHQRAHGDLLIGSRVGDRLAVLRC